MSHTKFNIDTASKAEMLARVSLLSDEIKRTRWYWEAAVAVSVR